MSSQDSEKDRIMHELMACQLRVNELEKSAASAQQQELGAAKGEFESLFELSPDALVLVDRQGRIARVNASAERLFGYTRKELVGSDHDTLLIPDRARAKHNTEMKRFMQNPRVRVMGMGLELRGRKKDGTEFAADIDLGPLEIDKEFFVLAVVRDATRRKRLEEDLQESEKRYRDLVELSPDGIVVHSEGIIVFSNAATARLLGLERGEQAVGRPVMEFLHPDYRHVASQRIRQTTDEGRMAPVVQGKFVKADGTVFFADVISMPYIHRDRPATLSILRDVTERKQAEDAIREQQERFRTIVRTALDGFWINDLQGHLLYVNDSYCNLIGYSREELLTMRIMDVEGAETAEDTAAHIQRITRTGGDRFETRHRRKDGASIDIEVSATYLDVEGGRFFVFLRDITERKRAEEALRASEKRYRSFIEVTGQLGWVTNAAGEVEEDIPSFRKFTGQSYEEVKGWGWSSALHPDDLERTVQIWNKAVQERTNYEIEYRVRRRDGVYRNFLARGVPVFTEGGSIREWVGTCIDITERKRLEEELENYRTRLEMVVAQRTAEFAQANEKLAQEIEEHRKSEEGLTLRATILDSAREAVFLVNPQGDFVYANEAAIRTYGYTRDEFLAMNLGHLMRSQEAPMVVEHLQTVLRTGQLEVEVVHLRKDKSLMPAEVRHSLIKTLHGQFIVSIMRDATTRFRLRSLLDRMPVLLWTTDFQLKLTSVTGSGLETLGLKRDDGVGLSLGEYLEKNGLGSDILAAHQRAREGELVGFRFESKKFGKIFHGWVAPLRDIEGEISGTISTAMEIPE